MGFYGNCKVVFILPVTQVGTLLFRIEAGADRLKEMLKGDTAKAYDFFLKANAQLQSMGIYPLPLPDNLRDYQLSLDFDE